MAFPYPRLFSIPPGHPFEHPWGVHNDFPYPIGASAASSPFVQQIDSTGVHNSASFRIATLEKELAQALSEKAAAEHAVHYILKVSACQWQSLGQQAEIIKDPKVEREIRSLATEVDDLRERLMETTVFLETTLRHRETTELKRKLFVCPSCIQGRTDTSRLFPEPTTEPVDLLGLDNDESLELCQSANSEDGLDDLTRFTQLPPKIDFGSGEKEGVQVVAELDRYNSLPQVDPPLVRHFESTTAETSNLSDIVDQSDDLLGKPVTADIKASHSGVDVGLGNTYGLSGVEDANNPRFSNNCALEQVFETASEFHNISVSHRRYAGRGDRQYPEFFRYGVRFQPSPAMPNTFQTLSFMNLPRSVTMQELMAKIRGGIVVSCQLLDTTSITGSFSARVRFLQESAALAYDDFSAANPIILHGRKARVSIVRTPTFPLSSPMLERIIQGGRTRCLEISNIPEAIAASRLLSDLKIPSVQTTGIEHMQMRKKRVLDLRFSSIWHAERAYAKLVTLRDYRGCGIAWAKDPCALPLTTMNKAAKADRPGIVLREDEASEEEACDMDFSVAEAGCS
jgi:hypothetical protein